MQENWRGHFALHCPKLKATRPPAIWRAVKALCIVYVYTERNSPVKLKNCEAFGSRSLSAAPYRPCLTSRLFGQSTGFGPLQLSNSTPQHRQRRHHRKASSGTGHDVPQVTECRRSIRRAMVVCGYASVSSLEEPSTSKFAASDHCSGHRSRYYAWHVVATFQPRDML